VNLLQSGPLVFRRRIPNDPTWQETLVTIVFFQGRSPAPELQQTQFDHCDREKGVSGHSRFFILTFAARKGKMLVHLSSGVG
jgi:hypothetical protein